VGAILPVHLYGGVSEWMVLHVLRRERGLAIIEDAAQAWERMEGVKAGGLGDAAAFSFYPPRI